MNAKEEVLKKDFILVVPHHLRCLKYFDKLYNNLLTQKIEIVYILGYNQQEIKYCILNKKKFEILRTEESSKFAGIFIPFKRYEMKKKFKELINRFEPKLIILYNDANPGADIFVKTARKFRILTLVLQWAVTGPEELDFKYREIKRKNGFYDKNRLIIQLQGYVKKSLQFFYKVVFLFLNVYSNHKPSFAQGDSDLVGVINKYSKDLIIKQGVTKKNILVVGSLNYDDALKVIVKSKDVLINKYNIKQSKTYFVYFSQPFYIKSISVISLNTQLNYIENLTKNLNSFYIKKKKSYFLIIKLHPAENVKDYAKFLNRDNIKIIYDADNNELIKISDVCISQTSTVLQNAIVLKKPVLSLNILGLEAIEIGKKNIGIKKCIETWEEFLEALETLDSNKDLLFNNISYENVIMDGKCYQRTTNLIKKLVLKTKFLKHYK